MPRKKGVAKVATMVRLVPKAKLLLERMSEGDGRPANILLEDMIFGEAQARGLNATDADVEAWIQQREPDA